MRFQRCPSANRRVERAAVTIWESLRRVADAEWATRAWETLVGWGRTPGIPERWASC